MKKRIRRVSGLQETFVELEHGREFISPQDPPPAQELKKAPTEISVEKETEIHYGQTIESYHPKI